MSLYSLQRLNDEHISALIALSDKLGWDYDRPELETAFHSGIIYGQLIGDEKVLSCAAVFPYGDQLASLGMVMVDPDYRRLGLGRTVTQKCMEHLRGTPIMLISTTEGKGLYEKLGFKTVDTVHKLIGEYHSIGEPVFFLPKDIEIVSLRNNHNDLNEMTRVDSSAVGADRFHFLNVRLKQATHAIQLRHKNGNMLGYGFSIQLPEMLLVGPIIAPDQDLAWTLIHELAKKYTGPIRIDLFSRHQKLIQILKDKHLKENRVAPVMMINAEKLPGNGNQLFAVAAQVFG